ncbi:MAG TPA: class I SAM-dependent methyltransferase [Thermoanaerobaculia bacterium]|nr:class I SAM-dependent methyltransferase [Thermoanaerobaculia bacterium]
MPHIRSLRGVVLDIGGGRDSPLARSWPAAARRLRLDISPRFAPDVLGDTVRLPIADAALDGVLISEVLEHVWAPGAALAEIHRVLREGGTLCGSVPFAIGVHADPHDYYRFTGEALAMLLRDFDAVEIRPHGNHLGAAWRALTSRWRWLALLSPLIRPLCRHTDSRWPVGYTFVARKRAASAGAGRGVDC